MDYSVGQQQYLVFLSLFHFLCHTGQNVFYVFVADIKSDTLCFSRHSCVGSNQGLSEFLIVEVNDVNTVTITSSMRCVTS